MPSPPPTRCGSRQSAIAAAFRGSLRDPVPRDRPPRKAHPDERRGSPRGQRHPVSGGGAVSFITFQQRCEDCGKTWNAAFGIVGTTQIAAPPEACPHCASKRIVKHANG